MACAVRRKRVSVETFDGPPLKRSRSSLTMAASKNMGPMSAVVCQLSRTGCDPANTSKIDQGCSRAKRKRDASPTLPSKRQRLHSTYNEQNNSDHVPLTSGDTQTGLSTAEVMDTTPAVVPEATTSNKGATEDIEMRILWTVADTVEAEGDAGPALTESITEPALTSQFETDFELICEIHPDVDPVYIREQLTLHVNDPHRVSTVTFDLYDLVEAPKREHREALEVVQQEYERLKNMKFDLNKFLLRYPDPQGTFDVTEPDVTEIYYDYAEVFLKNEFRYIKVPYIKEKLRESGFHLTPAYNILKSDNEITEDPINRKHRLQNKSHRRHPRSDTYEYPQGRDVIDEDFFWERLFILNQEEILGHIAAEKEAKQLCLEEARSDGRLRECTICVSSEVLLEDMVACQNEHLFCKDCVQHSTEELLGQACASFPCLEAGCGCQYTLATMEKALRRETYSLVLRRMQSEEIRLADIEDMVSCPFCPYAVVMWDDVSSSVFHCENPNCMEDSCRMCKEVAHPPYSCEEFRGKKQVEFGHFVANQMAEAMIRNCPKCGLRFYKEDGCNSMRCTRCGTQICYVCREQIKPSDHHFSFNPRCQRYEDTKKLHKEEIAAAFKEADTKYREQHPELRNTNIAFADSAEYNLLKAYMHPYRPSVIVKRIMGSLMQFAIKARDSVWVFLRQ